MKEDLDKLDRMMSRLVGHRQQLLGYVRKKLSSPELAEDVLQDSLLKALRAAPDLRDEERLIPWFYQILNHAIIDTYRRRGLQSQRLESQDESHELIPEPEQDDATVLCACFRELIPTLKSEYAQLIERMDLANEDATQVAKELNIDRNNLKVRHHRARQALRKRLEETCRVCASHGCLDCTCQRR